MPSQGAPVSIWVHTYLVGWIYLNLGPRFRWLWNFPSLSWTKSKPKGWHGFRICKFTKNRPRNFFNPQILWATVTHKDGQNSSTMKQTKYLIGNLSHAIPIRTYLHSIQNIIWHGYPSKLFVEKTTEMGLRTIMWNVFWVMIHAYFLSKSVYQFFFMNQHRFPPFGGRLQMWPPQGGRKCDLVEVLPHIYIYICMYVCTDM